MEDTKLISQEVSIAENTVILVTGGAGFIGSNFINTIFPKIESRLKWMINLDILSYAGKEENVFEKVRNNPKYVFIKGDICNGELVGEVLEKYGVTHILHFAAESDVTQSFRDPMKFLQSNIIGTFTLLEESRKYGRLSQFLNVSTDETQGQSLLDDIKGKTEEDKMNPSNFYAATKGSAELMCNAYYHSFKIPIVISRSNNIFGRMQDPEKLIAKFIKLLKEGKKVTIEGTGCNVRGFVHAYDVAEAFELLLIKGVIGQTYNIGCDPSGEYSVLEIAKILIKLIKKTDNYDEHITYIPDRIYNDLRYLSNSSKIRALGWKPKIDLITGLQELI